MVVRETKTVDSRARVTLPKDFAKATVVLEQVSEIEVRIHKASAIADNAGGFSEENITTLLDRDRDRFVQLLENPPRPNAALKKAMAKQRKQHG